MVSIWGLAYVWLAYPGELQSKSKFDRVKRFSFCVINLYSKYTWVIPMKDKKGETVTNAFQKITKESTQGPNKIWLHKDIEFYNILNNLLLESIKTEIYSTQKEEKLVVAEGSVRTLKKNL